ncbi:MAG: hypothetical protein JWN26_34 [Candidatus Saccharibacteria bacterium]|nr:hypothetical protein [Candidatus Saccharibacteria bacterium]
MSKLHNQQGAVSLLIVLFSALLITVITVGFVRLMLTDQQQASTNDLSQSALDSAQAGVEDGKRALLRYQNVCATDGVAACSQAYTDLTAIDPATGTATCNQGLAHIIDPLTLAKPEVPVVAQGNGSATLDQAYTCVKIETQTPNYLGSLSANASAIIPIKSQSTVTSVLVQWYDSKNISNNNLSVSLLPIASIPVGGSPATLHPPLYNQTATGWGPDRPSIMRTQLMQFGSSFSETDFDNTNALGQSNANTVFLYPTGTKGTVNTTVDEVSFVTKDFRLTAGGAPVPVSCNGSLSGGGFACSVKLDLPTPINGGSPTAFLRLSALYNASNYSVTLYNGSSLVNFDNVQPSIDSTGRANDLYRRVSTRVTLTDSSFIYPEAAIDLTGNFCKNFVITYKASDYSNSCTP